MILMSLLVENFKLNPIQKYIDIIYFEMKLPKNIEKIQPDHELCLNEFLIVIIQ